MLDFAAFCLLAYIMKFDFQSIVIGSASCLVLESRAEASITITPSIFYIPCSVLITIFDLSKLTMLNVDKRKDCEIA